jgi:phage baseplate assembly protein gpV
MARNLADAFEDMARSIVAMREELVDANRRVANMMRPGKVKEVDAAKGMMKLSYAEDEDGKEVVSPWIPWTQRAGGSKGQNDWDPPAVGEQMMMFSPSGDVTEASWGSYGGWSNDNPQVHNALGEEKYTVGEHTSRHMTGNAVTYKTKMFNIECDRFTVNGKEILLVANAQRYEGNIVVKGDIAQNGIHVDNNGKHG